MHGEQNVKKKKKIHLSGLIGTASHPDMQKIRIIRFFFENRLLYSMYLRLNLSTTPDLKF